MDTSRCGRTTSAADPPLPSTEHQVDLTSQYDGRDDVRPIRRM